MVKVTTPVSLEQTSEEVQKLLEEREKARAVKDFAKSDILRQRIASRGYLVNDLPDGYEIFKMGDDTKKAAKSYLVLFGSGENAPSAVDIYRQLFLSLGKRDLKIALITTPAGFQPNVEYVYQEIKDYLLASLPDFNLIINIVFANRSEDANNLDIVSEIEGADIIFTGPGSPTYAAKNLKDTLLIRKVEEMVKNGTTLILASAATIAFSHFALPVYEIYKVGDDLHWQEGLDFYEKVWQRATIIPHFNNTEGGEHLDTSHCFVGAQRFSLLKKQLPANEWVLGLDEHTVYIVDLDSQERTIKGKGSARTI
jgi:cyanophycinase-like exopeptidase